MRAWLFFALLALLSLAGYLLLAFWFPLPGRFNHAPLYDIASLAPSLAAGLAYGGLLVGLFGVYGLAYRLIKRPALPQPLLLLLISTTLFILPLIFTYPINATDVYRYYIRGRIAAVYGQDPFTTPPSALADDPYRPLAGEWAGETSPYGPLWELPASLISGAAGDNLYLGLLLFKGLGGVAHLLITILIWLALQGRGRREQAGYTLLWAWNPALLLTLVANSHNDGLMLLWLMAGFLLLQRRHWLAGLLLMTLAPLTKPAGALALPFFWLAALREQDSWRARGRLLLLGGLGSLGLLFLAFWPFASPLELAERLAREAGAGASFSPVTLLLLILRNYQVEFRLAPFAAAGLILLTIGGVWLLWRVSRGRAPQRAAADIYALYLLQALNFRIWYAAWLFPWLLLDESRSNLARGRLLAGLLFLLTSQLSVLIYSHIRRELLAGDQLAAHLLGVPFTFLLPLLVAGAAYKLLKRGT